MIRFLNACCWILLALYVATHTFNFQVRYLNRIASDIAAGSGAERHE